MAMAVPISQASGTRAIVWPKAKSGSRWTQSRAVIDTGGRSIGACLYVHKLQKNRYEDRDLI
jgi:hypothetical protein